MIQEDCDIESVMCDRWPVSDDGVSSVSVGAGAVTGDTCYPLPEPPQCSVTSILRKSGKYFFNKWNLTSRLAMLAMSGGRSTFQKSRSFCAVTVDSSSALSSNICRGRLSVPSSSSSNEQCFTFLWLLLWGDCKLMVAVVFKISSNVVTAPTLS